MRGGRNGGRSRARNQSACEELTCVGRRGDNGRQAFGDAGLRERRPAAAHRSAAGVTSKHFGCWGDRSWSARKLVPFSEP
jgi:hypothetical protein